MEAIAAGDDELAAQEMGRHMQGALKASFAQVEDQAMPDYAPHN